MNSPSLRGTRPGTRHLGGRPRPARPEAPTRPAHERRGAPLLAAATGRHGHLSRRATRGRRGFPGPVSRTVPFPHRTPVPTPAHSTPRAIRVHRSPR